MWGFLFPRLYFPSIKEYNFIPKIEEKNNGWGQYVIIDEPSILHTFIEEDDKQSCTYCCRK